MIVSYTNVFGICHAFAQGLAAENLTSARKPKTLSKGRTPSTGRPLPYILQTAESGNLDLMTRLNIEMAIKPMNSARRTMSLCVHIVISLPVALATTGLDLLTGGSWPVRGVLAIAGIAVALTVKRRSVFKDRPEPTERDVLVLGLKTVLMVFGAALLATVLLQAVVEQPEVPDVTITGWDMAHDAPPSAGS